jgi:iron complex outermembrane receptor protein
LIIWGENLAPNVNIRDRYYFSDASKKADFTAFAKATLCTVSGYADIQGRFVDSNP